MKKMQAERKFTDFESYKSFRRQNDQFDRASRQRTAFAIVENRDAKYFPIEAKSGNDVDLRRVK